MLSDFRLWICNFIISYIPFHFVRLTFYKYVMGYKIGMHSSIHIGAKFNCAKNFNMGNNSTINQFCRIDNRGGITIKHNVSISPYVKLICADHDIYTPDLKGRERPIIIEDNVFIGADSVILGNVTVAHGSIIGAKSLLTQNTKPFGIYFGIPCKFVKDRQKVINYNASYKRWFH